MTIIYKSIFAVLLSCISTSILAQQSIIPSIQSEIVASELGELSDVQELVVTNQYTSKHSQINHVYLSQAVNGIRIGNSNINAVVSQKTGKVVKVVGKVIPNPGAKASGSEGISLESAINAQLASELGNLDISENNNPNVTGGKVSITITGADYSHQSVAEKIFFFTPEEELRLAWSFDAEMKDHQHWYYFVVDAENGELLAQNDWTIKCNIPGHNHAKKANSFAGHTHFAKSISDGSGYLVYDLPIESPNHGARTLEQEPALALASPFGWHDTNGATGAEFTSTRGNNVFAYEDVSDSNEGDPAQGGSGLEFIFDFNSNAAPSTYLDAAITNLFFTNNKIHDILHMYGFDEAAGNFQETNYSGDGFGSDYVRAEAQDGGGINNANFATPPEGQNPRMQMYLWDTEPVFQSFQVNSPSELAGTYASTNFSDFGPTPFGDVTGNLVLVEDGVAASNDGCQNFTNAGEISGNIAILDRGNCSFVDKVLSAQNAGAVACIVINDEPGLLEMGGASNEINIPSLMITQTAGTSIKATLNGGETVNATLLVNGVGTSFIDGSFDNGIVIHEYGHGISTRLTGGPSEVNCLFNDEQMGEGWSDFYGIALTASPDDANPVNRPMATFANGEPINGTGIRPTPYDTSFTVNPFTYGDVANEGLSQPHGIGFVWGTMLWDLYWEFVEEYGFDPDLYAGTGGNNMVIQLVTDGLKLQACQPGFVDGRDAILLADELLFDGANQCLIWKVFARRGLGFSADQGSSQNRFDGVEAFDIPTFCTEAVNPPNALFSVSQNSSCTGFFQFNDQSTDTPQGWLWNFGDGQTSTEQNPAHVYEEPGTYSVSLTVTNTLGEDTELIEDLVVYALPAAPIVSVEPGCIGEVVNLTSSPEVDVTWTDENDEEVGTGESISVELGDTPDTYFATVDQFASVFVGPENGDFGNGGNHATDFVGTVDFQTFEPVVIESAWVESGATGTRVITLWNDASGAGDVVEQIAVNIDFTGGGTIDLGFEITTPGTYSIGLNQADLFRNDDGTDYPYTEDDLITIIGSSAGPDYYYYFYNLEVDVLGCESDPTEVVTEGLGIAEYGFEVDGLTVNFSDLSSGAESWSWNFGDGNTSNESDPDHTYSEVGTYTVTLTINGGCVFTDEITVGTVGIEDNLAERIVLSPNPASDRIQVQIPDDSNSLTNLRLMDVAGRLVKVQAVQSNTVFVDLNQLSSGTYVLQLMDGQGAVQFSERVVIAR